MKRLEYNDFCAVLIELVRKHAGERYCVDTTTYIKNNLGEVAGLQIGDRNTDLSMALAFSDLYAEYEKTNNLDSVVNMVLNTATGYFDETTHNTALESLTDFSKCRNKVFLRIVSWGLNKGFVKDGVHKRFLDLEVMCYICLSRTGRDMNSTKVTKALLEAWGVSGDELFGIALENTQKMFPIKILDMNTISGALGNTSLAKTMIMTNESKLNGATTVLYPGALQDVGRKLGGDFYALPSSIHEWFLIQDTKLIDPKGLRENVKFVNATLDKRDLLSYNVYHYNVKTDKFTIV